MFLFRLIKLLIFYKANNIPYANHHHPLAPIYPQYSPHSPNRHHNIPIYRQSHAPMQHNVHYQQIYPYELNSFIKYNIFLLNTATIS
jgi:hypothetical protein